MFCPQCGTQNTEDSKFCIKCGKEIIKVGDTPADESVAASTPQPQPEPQPQPQPVIQQQPAYKPAPVTAQPTGQHTNMNQLPGPAVWGALLIIIGFFLKWFGAGPFGISAFDFLTKANRIFGGDYGDYVDSETKTIITIFMIGLIVLLVAAVIAALYALSLRIDGGLFTICKVLPVIILAAGLIYGFTKFSEARGDYDDFDRGRGPGLFDMLQIGFYLSFAGSVVLLFQKRRS